EVGGEGGGIAGDDGVLGLERAQQIIDATAPVVTRLVVGHRTIADRGHAQYAEDAATILHAGIARQGATMDHQRATVVHDCATGGGGIAGQSAAIDHQRTASVVETAAAATHTEGGLIVGYRAATDRYGRSTGIVNAAAQPPGAITADGAVRDSQRAAGKNTT